MVEHQDNPPLYEEIARDPSLGVNYEDFALALSLALDDIEEASHGTRLSKLPANSDFFVAVDLARKEEQEWLESLRLAKALASAGDLPPDLVDDFQRQDVAERRDRILATSMAGTADRRRASDIDRARLHTQMACPPAPAGGVSIRSGVGSSSTTRHSMFDRPVASSSVASSSGTSKSRKSVSFASQAECVSCMEPGAGEFTLSCTHAYCLPCLKNLCRAALSDRKFVPVRCCKVPIPDDLLLRAYSKADLAKYNQFVYENLNPPKANATELDLVMSGLINEKNWKICAQCGAVVERKDGCIHMTCFCRYEFCYTCLKQWHQCKCELYPPRELEAILDNRAIPGNREDRQHLGDVLRNYYGHAHNWSSGGAKGVACSQCNWVCDRFSMYCRDCREIRCRRCTFNL